jgi:hypothetical protein
MNASTALTVPLSAQCATPSTALSAVTHTSCSHAYPPQSRRNWV